LSDGILFVSDIVADVKAQRLFWVDYRSYSIESANYDGSQRRVIYKRIGCTFFALALDEVIFNVSDISLNEMPGMKMNLYFK